jgi:hypothetical protein
MLKTLKNAGVKPVPAAEMSAHSFTYAGLTYEVCFHQIDGEWLATLHVSGSNHGRPLHAPAEDTAAASNDKLKIRAGYIGIAKWLVQTGQWPDREIKSNSGPVWAA